MPPVADVAEPLPARVLPAGPLPAYVSPGDARPLPGWSRVTVEVTALHLRLGARRSCSACPVVLALGERLRPGLRAVLTERALYIVDVGAAVARQSAGYRPADEGRPERWRVCHRLAAGHPAREFVHAFDSGGPERVAPFAFTITLPEEILS